jgi:hypothetical protein
MHTAEKIKEERKKETETPSQGCNTRNNITLTIREDNTGSHNRFSKGNASKKKQFTSVVVARSKILEFHHGKSLSSQNNNFSKTVARYNQ